MSVVGGSTKINGSQFASCILVPVFQKDRKSQSRQNIIACRMSNTICNKERSSFPNSYLHFRSAKNMMLIPVVSRTTRSRIVVTVTIDY